jgi:hypothetical protein
VYIWDEKEHAHERVDAKNDTNVNTGKKEKE